MEAFSASLALCAGNSTVSAEFPSQRLVTWSFDVSLIYTWTNGWVNQRTAGGILGIYPFHLEYSWLHNKPSSMRRINGYFCASNEHINVKFRVLWHLIFWYRTEFRIDANIMFDRFIGNTFFGFAVFVMWEVLFASFCFTLINHRG